MKIISGKYKGRNIIGFDIVGTRPTMDRVKESLFAMIQNYIDNSNCLDLFAGSGNLGLEAMSEGASACTFIDSNKVAVKTINENLAKLNIEERETFKNIVNFDLTDYLTNIKTETLLIWGDKDYDTPLRDGILMKRKIKNSELIVFKDSTHYSYLENLDVILRIIYIYFND